MRAEKVFLRHTGRADGNPAHRGAPMRFHVRNPAPVPTAGRKVAGAGLERPSMWCPKEGPERPDPLGDCRRWQPGEVGGGGRGPCPGLDRRPANVGLVGCASASVWPTRDWRGAAGLGMAHRFAERFSGRWGHPISMDRFTETGRLLFGCNNGPTSERLKDFGRLSGPCIAWRFRVSSEIFPGFSDTDDPGANRVGDVG
jgi:hypothetical protein